MRNRRKEDKAGCSFGIRLIPVMFIDALNDGGESILIRFSKKPVRQEKKRKLIQRDFDK